jgi:hypothetical protein
VRKKKKKAYCQIWHFMMKSDSVPWCFAMRFNCPLVFAVRSNRPLVLCSEIRLPLGILWWDLLVLQNPTASDSLQWDSTVRMLQSSSKFLKKNNKNSNSNSRFHRSFTAHISCHCSSPCFYLFRCDPRGSCAWRAYLPKTIQLPL